jgi:hypothetical protein
VVGTRSTVPRHVERWASDEMKKGITVIATISLIIAGLVFLYRHNPGSGIDTPPQNLCCNNLRQIQYAKEEFAENHGYISNKVVVTDATFTADDLSTNYIRGGFVALHCPKGGTYSINKLSEDPSCSFASQDERHSFKWMRKESK